MGKLVRQSLNPLAQQLGDGLQLIVKRSCRIAHAARAKMLDQRTHRSRLGSGLAMPIYLRRREPHRRRNNHEMQSTESGDRLDPLAAPTANRGASMQKERD